MDITLANYEGQHAADAAEGELTNQITLRAVITVERARKLLDAFGEDRALRSGWRPAATNASTPGAATHSKHMTGEAIDICDDDGSLDAWCMANQDVLEQLGLWLESPDSTPSWCHVQIVPPGSGHRVFIP